MRTLIIVFMLLYFCRPCFADFYAVEKEDGSVSVINYMEGSQDSLDDVIHELGFDGLSVVRLKEIPKDRKDRDAWVLSGLRVIVDKNKKKEIEDQKSLKESERDAVLSKLKITKEEAKKLKEIING